MKSTGGQRIGLVLVSQDTALSLRFCSSLGRLSRDSGVPLFVFAGGMPIKEQLHSLDCTAYIVFADPTLGEESDSIDLSLFGTAPCILVNFSRTGFPSLTTTLYPASKELLQSCFADKKKIACIQGPSNNALAQQSFQAYRDTLAENSLALDFKLVSDIGMEELLDHRALVPGEDFDAIYCFGSEQALDIETHLQAKGFAVQVAVSAAEGGSPFPSVVLPISQMALPAWKMALSLEASDRVFSSEVSLCSDFLQSDLFANKPSLLKRLVRAYDLDAGQAQAVSQLVDGCTHLDEENLSSLRALFSLFLAEGGSLALLHELLFGFSLLHGGDARLFLQLASHASQMQASFLTKQQTLFSRMQKAMEGEAQQSSRALRGYLPLLGIRSALVVQQQVRKRVVAGFNEETLIEGIPDLSFDTGLVPPTVNRLLNEGCWLYLPVGHGDTAGYMLLETSGCPLELVVLLKALFLPLIVLHTAQEPEGCVVAIGDGPKALSLSLTGTRQILLHSSDEFFHAIQDRKPSLLIVDAVDVPFFTAVRSRPSTSRTPIILVKDSFSSQDATDVLLIPHCIMAHSSVAQSRPFLVRLASLMAGDGQGLPTMTSSLVKRAVAFIDEHIHTQFSRLELAEAVNASEDYLGRIFRKEMGLSLWPYVHMHRIAMATDMLKQTPLSVTEIANRTGFKDLAYFSRMYKKVTGFPPSQVRSQKP